MVYVSTMYRAKKRIIRYTGIRVYVYCKVEELEKKLLLRYFLFLASVSVQMISFPEPRLEIGTLLAYIAIQTMRWSKEASA